MRTQIRQENGIAILEPNGKIVGSSVTALRDVISPQIETADTPRILINFGKVNKIDGSGLVALMEARTTAARKQGRIGVINVGKHIKDLVAVSRIVSLFEHFDSEDAAVSALAA